MHYLKVWTSFLDIIRPLSDDEKGRLFTMMLQYAQNGQEPGEIAGNERFIWPAAKQSIDLTAEKNEKLRANGSKGGQATSKNKQKVANDSKTEQNETDDSHNIMKSNVMKNNVKKGNDNNIRPLKRFIPPTIDDVKAYCDERGIYLIDPERFITYYETRGWMLTNNRKMVDWKAAVRLWEKNERDRQKQESLADLPL